MSQINHAQSKDAQVLAIQKKLQKTQLKFTLSLCVLFPDPKGS